MAFANTDDCEAIIVAHTNSVTAIKITGTIMKLGLIEYSSDGYY